MSELGRLLAETRTANRLSLADVEAATRIRRKYLEALEMGAFAELPRGAVARGFLRSYARFLNLNVDEVIYLYELESGDTGDEVSIAEPGQPRLVDYRPLEVELIDGQADRGWLRWVLAAALILVIGGGGWWLLSHNPDFGPMAWLQAAEATSTPTPTATATAWVVTATPRPTSTNTPVLPTPTSDLLTLPTPTLQPTPTPTPSPTATPERVASIALDMFITQRSWVRVIVDDEIVEEALLEAGEERSWDANQSIFIRTGNAGGVSLTLNGEDLGIMGKVGEVLERQWVIDRDLGTEQALDATVVPGTAPEVTPTPAG